MATIFTTAEDLTVVVGVLASIAERYFVIQFEPVRIFSQAAAHRTARVRRPQSLTTSLKLPASDADISNA